MASDTTNTFINLKCSLKFSCSIILDTTHYADGFLTNHYKDKFQILFPGINVSPQFDYSLLRQPHHLLISTQIFHSNKAVLFTDQKSTRNTSPTLYLGKLYPSFVIISNPNSFMKPFSSYLCHSFTLMVHSADDSLLPLSLVFLTGIIMLTFQMTIP